MSRIEVIQEAPLTDDPLYAHEIIGYVLVTCKELGMERYHGDHLAVQTAIQIKKTSPKVAERAFNNASSLSKTKGMGVGELMKWSKAKSLMKKPVAQEILDRISADEELDSKEVSEIQAAGYLSLAALELNFLSGQLTPLEMEFNYQLRVLPPDKANTFGLNFLGLELEEN
ncbi:hypothetical protein F4V43_07500 [Paenibacillus spiritus]|uniref:Uncharacterized protein n=1 Tax=Paenibacillus spiritus TaxID=2496557 RepID=A0A5J5GD08_9BACL|nr:hypothetical protein [Paenibacillus spiritus]KAA9005907.1 hypothetical protein F4V43_07500 [Paenibacillus spiritus]